MPDITPRPLKHQITLPAVLESIPQAEQFVMKVLRDAKAPENFIVWIRLVVDEAAANAIEHGGIGPGGQSIRVSCEVMGESFQIQIEDFQGKLFDPEYFRRIATVKDWGKGGRGILLMESIMDHVSYLIDEGKHTVLFMEKKIEDKGDQP